MHSLSQTSGTSVSCRFAIALRIHTESLNFSSVTSHQLEGALNRSINLVGSSTIHSSKPGNTYNMNE